MTLPVENKVNARVRIYNHKSVEPFNYTYILQFSAFPGGIFIAMKKKPPTIDFHRTSNNITELTILIM